MKVNLKSLWIKLEMTETHKKIRTIEFDGLKIGGEETLGDLSKAKPVFALQLNIFNFEESPEVVKEYFEIKEDAGDCKICQNAKRIDNAIAVLEKAQKTNADIIALKFNVKEENLDDNIEKSKTLLKELLPKIEKPLLVQGANNKSIDTKLLPALMDILNADKKEAIIAFADENTYKEITPKVVEGNHILAIKTPIDINLAKEMNILTSDLGLDLNRILIDTDMGGLGYGLEYGYSIMERIKLAAFDSGDKMLNMPLIAFAGEEAYKAKEAKSDTFSDSWGDFKKRSIMFEITTAAAVMAAGANLIVLEHPDTIKTLKGNLNG